MAWIRPNQEVSVDGTSRPLENDPSLGTDLFVNPNTGSDDSGDGSASNPYETIMRAALDIGTANSSTVTINIQEGEATIPRVLGEFNNITVQGPTPTVTDTATVDAVVAATTEGGIILDVTGLSVAEDGLKDTLIEYTSGAPSGVRGWIYKNTATGGGTTRIWCTLGSTSLLAPAPADTIDLLSLGATLSLSSDGSTIIQTSVQLNFKDLIIDNPAAKRVFSINASDKIDLESCSVRTSLVRGGFGGSMFLTTCYVRCSGSASDGMAVVTRKGNLRIASGTVFDGSFATAGRAFISGEAGGFWTYRGQCVLTEMTDDQLFDGVSWAAAAALGAYDSLLFDPDSTLSAGFKMNTRGEGSNGGGALPNLYGEVGTTYAIEAEDGWQGGLGPDSDLVTAFGTNNAVSADGGANNVAQAADLTQVRNGSPSIGLLWLDVGDTLGFENGWQDHGGVAVYEAEYAKDAQGFVYLRGTIKGGALGSSAFTLPAGCRPSKNVDMPVITGGAPTTVGSVRIEANGRVNPRLGDTTFFSLGALSFSTVDAP